MRMLPICMVISTLLSMPAYAASLRERIPEEEALASLELRAAQAPVKSQCYVYAQLVHEIVDYSARQYAAGNPEKASDMLKHSQDFIRKIRIDLTGNTKKVKESQILLRRTAYRLTDLLHSCNHDDRPLLEETLAQLKRTDDDLLLCVFRK